MKKDSVNKKYISKKRVATAVSATCIAVTQAAMAAPTGADVTYGDVTNITSTTATINSQNAIINWDSFDILAGESFTFDQLNASSIVLNRISSGSATQILGSLEANGSIFILNNAGVVFGSDSTVDVAGLLASTFDISDEDFAAAVENGESFKFTQSDLANSGVITNSGTINAGDIDVETTNGFVYLIAKDVTNNGNIIVANVGTVTLSDEGTYSVDLAGSGLVTFDFDSSSSDGVAGNITNSTTGSIEAETVVLSATDTASVISSVVNDGDISEATSITVRAGSITGSGTMTASGDEDTGGSISLTATGEDGNIGSSDQALTVDADGLSASTEDGSIYINVNNNDDETVNLNGVTAGEYVTVSGVSSSSSGTSDTDGNIVISDGSTGTHDIEITATGTLGINDSVNATGDLTLTSTGGSILGASTATITGVDIALTAAEAIGIDGTSLQTASSSLSAEAQNGGIFITESNGLNVTSAVATGAGATISFEVSTGDTKVSNISATTTDEEESSVIIQADGGAIISGASSGQDISADAIELSAEENIGSSDSTISTHTLSLTLSSETSGDGIYIDNDQTLENIEVQTYNGDVVVTNTASDANLTFSSGNISVDDGLISKSLSFDNQEGSVNTGNITIADGSVALTASEDVASVSDTEIVTGELTLDAGSSIDVVTKVTSLDATASNGDISVDNSTQTGSLSFTSDSSGSTTLTTGGDLELNSVNADAAVSLTAAGSITGESSSSDISSTDLTLSATSIGSSEDALVTASEGEINLSASNGGIYLSNTGDATNLSASATQDIDLSISGSAIVNLISAGGSVTFSATGAVTDGNDGLTNIEGSSLDISAQSIGDESDTLEIIVESVTLDTTNGGIYITNTGSETLDLSHAKAINGDINISSAGDIDITNVTAASKTVTITSGGAIEDGRSDDDTGANIEAHLLVLDAQDGIGADGALSLDVDQMSASSTSGDVNATNLGAINIDADSIAAAGTSGVSIIATSITIVDSSGTTLTINGGSLYLEATSGNIVFINQDDTIEVKGGGSITLIASEDASRSGYYGNIITGNLTTEDGDITLTADKNITLGLLNAGNGDITVIAGAGETGGVILDGNGDEDNLIGDHVTLIANTPNSDDAELDQEAAADDYTYNLAVLTSTTSELNTSDALLISYTTQLSEALSDLKAALKAQSSQQSSVNSANSLLSTVQFAFNRLNNVLTIAKYAAKIAKAASSTAQAVPISGDGGSSSVANGFELAVEIAQDAVDVFQTEVLDPAQADLDDAEDVLATLKANTESAQSSYDDFYALVATYQAIVSELTQDVENATIATAASLAVREQSIAAYRQAQGFDMSEDNALGVQANTLDMSMSDGSAVDSDIYLDSAGSLGLGNISSVGSINVDVDGDLTIVGNVETDSSITLVAGGTVYGSGGYYDDNGVWVEQSDDDDDDEHGAHGVLVADTLSIDAGTGVSGTDTGDSGVADDSAVYTAVNTIAVNSTDGDIYIDNDKDGAVLELGTVDDIDGLQSDGDLSLVTSGDLKLTTQIVDTDTTSDNTAYVTATRGEIIDNNGSMLDDSNAFITDDSALNVIAHEVNFTAQTDVELDTQADILNVGSITGDGDLTLRNTSDLTVNSLSVSEGHITIYNKGDMTIQTMSASSDDSNDDSDDEGNIDLVVSGDVNDDSDNSTRISALDLNIDASGSVGANGENSVRALDTSVDSVTIAAKGEVNVEDSDDIDVDSVTTTTGNITLTSQTGSLAIDKVVTSGADSTVATVTLEATSGSITSLNSVEDEADIEAKALAIMAGTGAGTGDTALQVKVDNLEADVAAGGLYIEDLSGDLSIGGVTPNLGLDPLTGLDVSGDVQVAVSDGDLTVTENIDQTGTGDVSLTSYVDQTYNADVTSAGETTLTATTGGITVNDVALTAGKGLGVDAKTDITLESATLSSTDDTSLTAGQSISMDKLTETDVETTLTAGAALSLTATEGSITSSEDTVLTAQAGKATFTSKGSTSLTDTTVSSTDDMGITSSEGSVSATTSSLTTGGALTADANQNMTLASATLSSTGDTSLTAGQSISMDKLTETDVETTLTAGAALSLTATEGSITSSEDTVLTAQAGKATFTSKGSTSLTDTTVSSTDDMGITSSEGSVSATTSSLTTGGALTADANQNMTLASATLSATGDTSLTAGQSISLDKLTETDVETTVTAGAALSLTATESSITSSEDTVLTAQAGKATLTSKGNTSLTDTTVSSSSDSDFTSEEGSISLANGTVTSGDSVNLTADLDITQSGSSVVSAISDVAFEAGEDVTVTRITSNDSISIEATEGAITAVSGSQDNIETSSLTLTAKNDIGSALSYLKTQVSELYASITGTGNLYLSEADQLTVKQATLEDGDAEIDAQDAILIESINANGSVDITSGESVSTINDGLITADVLSVDSSTGVDVTTDVDTIDAAVTGTGDIDVTNTGDLSLTSVSASNGDIDISTSGDMVIDQLSASGDTTLSATSTINGVENNLIVAGNLSIDADKGVGDSTALNLSVDSLTATTDEGDISLTQSGDLVIESASSSDGNIDVTVDNGDVLLGEISSEGDITLTANDGSLSNYTSENTIVGNTVSLTAANDIGESTNVIRTNATNIVAESTSSGDIYLQESDGLDSVTAQTANGNIQVTTLTGDMTVESIQTLTPGNAVLLNADNGSIYASDGNSTNIITDILNLIASQGIGLAKNYLDVQVAQLSATSGAGGTYINNSSDTDLTVNTLTSTGEVSLSSDGDVSLLTNISGNGVDISSQGSITQTGNITSTSYVNVYANDDVTAYSGTATTATGNVLYHAGDALTVSTIKTSNSLDAAASITLEGSSFKSVANYSGSISGASIDMNIDNANNIDIDTLVGNLNNVSRVSVNGITQGGTIVEDSQQSSDLVSSMTTSLFSDFNTDTEISLPETFEFYNIANEWYFDPNQ